MVRPTREEARAYCEGNTIVPISMELYADIKTPIAVLRGLKEESNRCYLLESVESQERWGRYSFLGYDPKRTVSCLDGIVKTCSLGDKGSSTVDKTASPEEILRGILSDYKSPRLDFLPPFTGGLVGYVSYDFIKYTEKSLDLPNINTPGFNDLELMLFDKVIVFDHLRQKIILIVNIPTADFENSYSTGIRHLKEMEAKVQSVQPLQKMESRLLSGFETLHTKERYEQMVETAKKYIYEGDIFQVVLSNRIEAGFEGDLLPTYRALRTVNPSPYMFYMSLDDLQIAGASPETLLSLKEGTLATFPIAGTCPRGRDGGEDEILAAALLADPKELSEHNMLVDLGRNDLGRISEFGSVRVEEYKKVLRFSHVSHLSSKVTGILRKGLDPFDALASILPAGTLSGAPKIRACEIINELEGNKRGIYGGAIGYMDFNGNMDFCIAIRFAVKKGKKIYVQAGAGIVADSVPEKENEECIRKAKAMVDAILLSQEVDR